MATTILTAPDIHCDGCAGAIKRSLGRLPGVQTVDVDVAAKRVAVEYDPAAQTSKGIQERLAAAGYPADVSAD